MNFKVGDWVEIFSSIHQIEIIDYEDENCVLSTYPNRYRTKLNDLRLWQPKEGEWCWMWNDGFDKPYLEKLMKIDKNGKFYAKSVGDRFKHCEPFIGELPSFIKDKQ